MDDDGRMLYVIVAGMACLAAAFVLYAIAKVVGFWVWP